MNTLDYEFLDTFNKIIDEVEASVGDAVLITIGSKKVFSSGFNLKNWENNVKYKTMSIILSQRLFARLLTINVPSLCIFNGHSIAGGVFLGLCHDEIWMINDPKKFIWANETSFGFMIPFAMAQLVKDTT